MALSAGSVCQPRESHVGGKPLSGRNILVVEDEMLILLLLEEIMIENGCASVKLGIIGSAGAWAH